MKRKTIKFKEYNLQLEVSSYRNNNRLAILAYADDESYSDITINLSDMYADGNAGFISDIAKSCGLEDKLVEEGIISDVLGSLPYNYGIYDIVVFDIEKLKEYDPKGVEEFQKLQEQEDEEEV